MSRLTRPLVATAAAAALALVPATPGAASDGPDTIALQTGSLPEGITSGPGDTFFAGARRDGAVRQYSTLTGELLRVVVEPRSDEVAVGLLYDAATSRLFVSGGATGDLTVYDARNGAVLYSANAGSGRFVNDVTITRRAAYFTDSRSAQLLVVPFGPGGSLPASGTFSVLRVTGDYLQPATGNGLNGIRTLPTGRLLVVSPGGLFAVDPATGSATALKVNGQPVLTGGDGLVLDGRTLYVVYGTGKDEVAVLKLDKRFEKATVVDVLTDDDTPSDLDRPTTGALVGGDLYVVNGRFGTIAASGNGGQTLPFSVSRVDLQG